MRANATGLLLLIFEISRHLPKLWCVFFWLTVYSSRLARTISQLSGNSCIAVHLVRSEAHHASDRESRVPLRAWWSLVVRKLPKTQGHVAQGWRPCLESQLMTRIWHLAPGTLRSRLATCPPNKPSQRVRRMALISSCPADCGIWDKSFDFEN